MICLISDGYWCPPPKQIQKINTGGAPSPCPDPPTIVDLNPQKKAISVQAIEPGKVAVTSAGVIEPDAPVVQPLEPEKPTTSVELVPKIIGVDEED